MTERYFKADIPDDLHMADANGAPGFVRGMLFDSDNGLQNNALFQAIDLDEEAERTTRAHAVLPAPPMPSVSGELPVRYRGRSPASRRSRRPGAHLRSGIPPRTPKRKPALLRNPPREPVPTLSVRLQPR